MGIVSAAFAAGTAVPASVVPGEGLIHCAVIAVNKTMHTGIVIGRAVPAIDKHRRLRLGTSHRMEHQPLDCDLSSCRIAGIFRQNALY